MENELDSKQLNEWMSQKWDMYASHPRRKKTLRFYVSMAGQFKVTLDTKVLYSGQQMTHALEVFRAA